jgi:hypothetical protein
MQSLLFDKVEGMVDVPLWHDDDLEPASAKPTKNTHCFAQLTVVGILVGLRVLTPIPYMLRT